MKTYPRVRNCTRETILVAALLAIFGCSSSSDGVTVAPNQSDNQTDGGGNDGSETIATDSDNQNNNDTNPTADTQVPESEATYRITFQATWSAATHPLNFPTNPHFSPLTGAVHGDQAVLWQLGQIASAGIEDMAETGSTSTLLSEVNSVIAEGRALSAIAGGGITNSPGNVSVDRVMVNRQHPKISLVSMLAPSPDWFVGVDGQTMLDDDGQFVNTLVLDMILYDSGTDAGLSFASQDQDSQPKEPISELTSNPDDSNFSNGNPAVGQLIFQKL